MSTPSTVKKQRSDQGTPSGLLLVDKPAGMTSHDVVSRVRRLARTRRVGHAGTLDPMATGLLILGVNSGTKLLQYVTGANKTYTATIRLGVATSTDDAEGEPISVAGCGPVSEAGLNKALDTYRGNIQQVPSKVSAIKVGGKRAYALVRSGEEVKLKARPVTIEKYEIVAPPRALRADYSQPVEVVDVDVEVSCSSGTYIRALARDLGEDLGVGGHLTALRRTHIGPWDVNQALTLGALEEAATQAEGLPILPLESSAATMFPTIVVSEAAAALLRHGQAPTATGIVDQVSTGSSRTDMRLVVSGQGRALAFVRQLPGDALDFKTVTVFPDTVTTN